jgi:hypothetical protein
LEPPLALQLLVAGDCTEGLLGTTEDLICLRAHDRASYVWLGDLPTILGPKRRTSISSPHREIAENPSIGLTAGRVMSDAATGIITGLRERGHLSQQCPAARLAS